MGTISERNARRVLLRELTIGAVNGLTWALVVALLRFNRWLLDVLIGLAMIINLTFAALSGVTIPLVVRRLGVDPALAGRVILTTVTGVVGFFAFLGLATRFLV